jgi:hypothetical protein
VADLRAVAVDNDEAASVSDQIHNSLENLTGVGKLGVYVAGLPPANDGVTTKCEYCEPILPIVRSHLAPHPEI